MRASEGMGGEHFLYFPDFLENAVVTLLHILKDSIPSFWCLGGDFLKHRGELGSSWRVQAQAVGSWSGPSPHRLGISGSLPAWAGGLPASEGAPAPSCSSQLSF